MSTENDKKKSIAKIKQAFDQKTYDNVGLRYKRGIKNIVGYIAAEKDVTISDIFRNALEQYMENITGKTIIQDIEPDIDMLLRVVHRPESGSTKYYIYKSDFNELLDLRNRAEENFNEQVVSENDLKKMFKAADSPFDTITRTLAKDEEWFWTDSSIYDTLYMLVYQAHK